MAGETILIVEDEPSIAENIEYSLQTEGFEPIWKPTAQEGLDAFRDSAPALIVLDVGLPDMSGFDVCREIRQSSQVPIVFLTAREGGNRPGRRAGAWRGRLHGQTLQPQGVGGENSGHFAPGRWNPKPTGARRSIRLKQGV